jgi:hypothetical protein
MINHYTVIEGIHIQLFQNILIHGIQIYQFLRVQVGDDSGQYFLGNVSSYNELIIFFLLNTVVHCHEDAVDFFNVLWVNALLCKERKQCQILSFACVSHCHCIS